MNGCAAALHRNCTTILCESVAIGLKSQAQYFNAVSWKLHNINKIQPKCVHTQEGRWPRIPKMDQFLPLLHHFKGK